MRKTDEDLEKFVEVAIFMLHKDVDFKKALVRTNIKGQREISVWVRNPAPLLASEGRLHKLLLSKIRKFFDEVIYVVLRFENQRRFVDTGLQELDLTQNKTTGVSKSQDIKDACVKFGVYVYAHNLDADESEIDVEAVEHDYDQYLKKLHDNENRT
jgi:hypothetical protein